MQLGLKRFKIYPHVSAEGQALIEFAIILLLVVLVVGGGAELAIAAYGSSKVSEAAKAGATEWGQAISIAKSRSQNDVGLGDHAVANFTSPSCVALNGDSADYNDGIAADRYHLDKRNQDNYTISSANRSIYLFNPLPIDHLSCVGTDPNRGGRSRISILVNGYGFIGDSLYVPGLPKINQAMYSMYQEVCLTGDELARCENADARLHFPPGKLCLGTLAGDENCPTGTANLGETGYYFFGASNVATRGSKQYIPSLAPEFRPTFQIECPDGTFEDPNNSSGCDTKTAPGDVNGCWADVNTSNACLLKVHVRYRSIFESFITFGLAELPDAALSNLPFFYNPSKVGLAVNSVRGIAGSEIGPIGATGNPTVKPFKDFRGCYESVNPGSLNYQVVSCN